MNLKNPCHNICWYINQPLSGQQVIFSGKPQIIILKRKNELKNNNDKKYIYF